MISVNVRTNSTRRTVNVDVTSTPNAVFAELGENTSTSMINLNGEIINKSQLDKTFEELGVADGSTANLNAIVKADGANE